ncbi:hypothetical protein EVAR_41878_1 [Eumeta japonica]|uniref:Uncharacterized protein n=1 Tax=Eumeta variegata TaxID=151549 RepID=A0A4C1X8U2_EUMVA|nr:hypothetical protein EVAR_41878_1 [Eumeta japonica]
MVARLRARLSWLDVACLTFGYLQIVSIASRCACSALVRDLLIRSRLIGYFLELLEPINPDEAVALTMVAVWAACVESVGPRPVFSDICPRLTVRILLTTITLVFAAMLVKGVHTRKEGHVLSYFVFGVVAAAGLVVQGTLLAAFEVDSLIACTIFLLIEAPLSHDVAERDRPTDSVWRSTLQTWLFNAVGESMRLLDMRIAVYALCLLMVYVVYRNIRLEKRPEHGPQNTPHEPKDTV